MSNALRKPKNLRVIRSVAYDNVSYMHKAYVNALISFSNTVPNKFRVVIGGSSHVSKDSDWDDAYHFANALSLDSIPIVLPGRVGISEAAYAGYQSILNGGNCWTVNLDLMTDFAPTAPRDFLVKEEALRLDILGALGAQFVFFKPGLGTDLWISWVLQIAQIMRSCGKNSESQSIYFTSKAAREFWTPKIVLVGQHFSYVEKMFSTMQKRGTISEGDESVITLVPSISEALALIKKEKTNFEQFSKEKNLPIENCLNNFAMHSNLNQTYKQLLRQRAKLVDALFELRACAGYYYTVTHFGSARPMANGYLKEAWAAAREYGEKLEDHNIDRMTGGGPGLMEAFLASENNGASRLGATVPIGKEKPNPYLLENYHALDFALRLNVFGVFSTDYSCDAYGGIGTKLELAWVWKILQRYKKALETKKDLDKLFLASPSITLGWLPKIVLIGEEMYDFVKTQIDAMSRSGTIKMQDTEILHFVKTHKEAASYILKRREKWRNLLISCGVEPGN